MRYYDLSKNWRKVRPHLNNPKVVETLHRDFNRYTYGRWRQKFPSDCGQHPFDFESCGWWCEHRGRRPQYWQYCKHAACHWLVNFNLERLAQRRVILFFWPMRASSANQISIVSRSSAFLRAIASRRAGKFF